MIKDPELLKQAVKAIEAEPRQWLQGSWGWASKADQGIGIKKVSVQHPWGAGVARVIDLGAPLSCGTTACLAGQVVTQAGWYLLQDPDSVLGETDKCINPETGEVADVEDKAIELLGIPSVDGNLLFYWSPETGEDEGEPNGPFEVEALKAYITQVTGVTFE
jgi:hypothetical protein